MFGLIEAFQSAWESLKSEIEYRNSWEVVETNRYYDTVIAQDSGYVVHIYERKTYENSIDGATKTGIETEVDSVWRMYNRSNWEPGRPLNYRGDVIECAENANLFTGVARGYRR